jgi:hypothetical protein
MSEPSGLALWRTDNRMAKKLLLRMVFHARQRPEPLK